MAEREPIDALQMIGAQLHSLARRRIHDPAGLREADLDLIRECLTVTWHIEDDAREELG